MRGLLTLLVIVVIVAIAAVATGFVDLSGRSGELPRVAVEGGRMPTVDADVGRIDVGTTNTTVEVPKIETERQRVELPTVDVERAR